MTPSAGQGLQAGAGGGQIRLAEPADLPSLIDRQDRLVGAPYPWPDRLGDGRDRGCYLALVMCVNDRVVGQVGVGPVNLRPDLVVVDRTAGRFDLGSLPWWKVHSLAVDPEHQGDGLGLGLLREVLQRMPSDLVGLVGSVEDTRTAALDWYRGRGFYVAATAPLRRREGDPIAAVALLAPPGEVFFHGYRHTVAEHLDGKGHPNFALRIARTDFRRQLQIRKNSMSPRGDTGYRQLATRIGGRADLPGCRHAAMGPRPLFVQGWDPQLMRTCTQCAPSRLEEIEPYDAQSHCDGCGRTRTDVVVSWAADEAALLIVTAGLCPACRAGIP